MVLYHYSNASSKHCSERIFLRAIKFRGQYLCRNEVETIIYWPIVYNSIIHGPYKLVQSCRPSHRACAVNVFRKPVPNPLTFEV